MCTNLIKINAFRNTRYFADDAKVQAHYYHVPCGKCDECRMTSKNDLFIRGKAEYEDCVAKGGKVAFLTFTYREVPDEYGVETAPKLYYSFSEEEKDKGWFYCADKSHRVNFHKAFRKFLQRSAKSKGVNLDVTYKDLWATEYGSCGTCRLHYHSLFYLPKPIVDLYDSATIEQDFLADVQRYWKYGMVSASTKGLFLDSYHGVEYVTKYCLKQISYYDNERIKAFVEAFKRNSLPSVKETDAFKLEWVKPYLPYHTHSKFFGLSLLDHFNGLSDDEICNKVDSKIPVVEYGITRYKNYPRYITRKLFYDYNSKDFTSHLNKLGQYYNLSRKVDKINRVYDSFKDMAKLPISIFTEDLCLDYANEYGLSRTSSLTLLQEKLKQHIENIVSDNTHCLQLAVYAVLLRGLSASSDIASQIVTSSLFSNKPIQFDKEIFLNDILENYEAYTLNYQDIKEHNFVIGKTMFLINSTQNIYGGRVEYSNLFRNLETELTFLSEVKDSISEQNALYYKQINDKIKIYKDLTNKYIYECSN